MIKLCTVIGARPQFIKAAAVSRAIAGMSGMEEFLVHTGQHYDDAMSDIFFRELKIPAPRYHLSIGSAAHGKQTGLMMDKIEEVALKEKPDCLLVYGDTNSTLAGALVAAKLGIPLAHVEAGLRSFNRAMPEEINRVLTDHCSSILFAPTKAAIENLRREGIAGRQVVLTGDVMLDIALWAAQMVEKNKEVGFSGSKLPQTFALTTIHRAESTDNKDTLENIVSILREVSMTLPVVWPMHPRTRAALKRDQLESQLTNVIMIEPVGYFQMTDLILRSQIVMTDSGGLQKEAFFHGRPCVTLRSETEWVELVESGWNNLVPPTSTPEHARIVLEKTLNSSQLLSRQDLYGTGVAGQEIVRHLINFFRSA